ncbi:MAG TPA: O-antigen ligase family protein [Rhodanobacteraceae bacterium]|jgi:O-antigen ligase
MQWLERSASIPAARSIEDAHAARKTRNNWFLYLFLFLLPLQNVQTGYLPQVPGGINFLNVGFALSLLGAWHVGGRLAQWTGLYRWVWLYLGWSFVTLLIGLSLFPTPTDMLRFNALKDSIVGVLLLFIVQMSVTDWTSLKRILIATILPLPYILRVTRGEHSGVAHWHYSDQLRISGPFTTIGSNEFGSFCVTSALVLFALLIATKWSRRWRALLLLGLACAVVCLLWTYSRTAYATTLIGGVCMLLLWRGRKKMVIPLLLGLLVVPSFLPNAVVERFDSTHVDGPQADTSTEMRYVFWDVAWDHFKMHPLVGTGYRTFADYNPYKMDTHNFFVRELVEKGSVGFLIVVGLFLSMARVCWRCFRDSPRASLAYALGLGMCAAWIALVIANIWGDRFTYTQMIGYFWVYLALTLKARELMPNERAAAAPVEPSATPRAATPQRLLRGIRPASADE